MLDQFEWKKSLTLAVLAMGLALGACGEDSGGSSGSGNRDWGNFGEEGDIVLGNMDAPISIIEYASVTCGACAAFHIQTYPFLKEEYIDTGLARYVMRPLPTAPSAMSRLGFMLARCVDESRYYNFIDALMRTQRDWAFNQDPNQRMANLARLSAQAGMTQNEFEACRTSQEGLNFINAQAEESVAVGIQSTPTFYINGEATVGALSWEQMEDLLIPHLPEELRPDPEEEAESGDS